jgi:hypothetical protein
MKRDMDLIRLILLALEGNQAANSESRKFQPRDIAYQSELLIDAGLVEGVVLKDEKGLPHAAALHRLTWQGHDFLDAMRDDSVWRKAKETILKPIGGVTFDLLLEWLKKEGRERLGLPPI